MAEAQIKAFPKKSTLNCKGKLLDLSTPKIMGIVNVTPDSFYDCGHQSEIDGALRKTATHLEHGAAIIDVGAVSTKPGAKEITIEKERTRLLPTIEAIRTEFPECIISADTYNAMVAKEAVQAGASMINDIGGGTLDKAMFETIAELKVPYIMMHIQGTPQTMQDNPRYNDVVEEVRSFFLQQLAILHSLNVNDIVIDLGFGFGKTIAHNFNLLRHMRSFEILGYPILAGLSRKSMIFKTLGGTPKDALNGTTALNMFALQNGASILRVHDVKEAAECIRLHNQLCDQ